jgi:hypothetical protein
MSRRIEPPNASAIGNASRATYTDDDTPIRSGDLVRQRNARGGICTVRDIPSAYVVKAEPIKAPSCPLTRTHMVPNHLYLPVSQLVLIKRRPERAAWQTDLTLFVERDETEEIEWGPFATIAWNQTRDEAEALMNACKTKTSILDEAIRHANATGCTIDIRLMPDPEPHAYETGLEHKVEPSTRDQAREMDDTWLEADIERLRHATVTNTDDR